VQSQPVDTYTTVTASQQATPSVTHITQTPTLTPQGKVVTNEMILTAAASMAPPQPTPTPFPTLEFTPVGRIAYVDKDTLHVMDGNGKNDVTTALPFGGFGGADFAWSPGGQTIVYSCYKINSLCFLNATDFGQSAPDVRKIDLPLPVSGMRTIESLTWSPDNKAIAFIRTSGYDSQLCVLMHKTMETDCSSSNLILKGLSEEDLQIFHQATSVIWSPVDANLLAMSVPSGHDFAGKIYLINLSQNIIEEIKTPALLFYLGRSVAWSPDGQRVAFSFSGIVEEFSRICQNYACLYSPGPFLATINIDGTNYEKVLDGTDIFYRLPLEDLQRNFPPISTYGNYYRIENPSWSPDGHFLTFVTEMTADQFHMMRKRAFRVDLQTGYFVMLEGDKSFVNAPISWSP
jgi:Tol biopolymer transport system component